MTSEVQSHITNRLHEMMSHTMMGTLILRQLKIVDTNSLGLAIEANAMIGENEWEQPIEYPVVILVLPDLPNEPAVT